MDQPPHGRLVTVATSLTTETTCRADIVRTFAGWTALSALRSGSPIKSRVQVYSLLRLAKFDAVLDLQRGGISAEEFAEWHRAATSAMCAAQPRLAVGWAAKLVNVYLKTAAYVGGLGRPGLDRLLHPPIDRGLRDGLKRRFPEHREMLKSVRAVKTIKEIETYETYEKIIADCREAAAELGCSLIEIEQLWEGGDAPSPVEPEG
jgi:hypothetical protein